MIEFCRVTLDHALAVPESETRRFVPGALTALWDHNPNEARAVIAKLLATGREQLRASVAQSYSEFSVALSTMKRTLQPFEPCSRTRALG